MQGSLHSGDARAGAGDALPGVSAGVAAVGRPASQLRRAVPGGVQIPQSGGCKEPKALITEKGDTYQIGRASCRERVYVLV